MRHQILRRRRERAVLPTIRDARLLLARHLALRSGGAAGCRDLLLLDTSLESIIRTARAARSLLCAPFRLI